MSKYNVLIIGAGGQGSEADQPGSVNRHKIISFAHAFSIHKGFELCGFVENNKERVIRAVENWGGAAYCCINHAIEVDGIDVAIIATPDNTHYEILKELAEYPLELVICEKPICENLQQAREIVELYKQKNIPLMVNYTRRFLPYYYHLKQYHKPYNGFCIFNRGWIHTATHAIDFFNMIGCDNYSIIESKSEERYWSLGVDYGEFQFLEARIGNSPVWDYYDKSHWYIVENAYNFLEGKEPLKCTGEDALKALEICFELMNKT